MTAPTSIFAAFRDAKAKRGLHPWQPDDAPPPPLLAGSLEQRRATVARARAEHPECFPGEPETAAALDPIAALEAASARAKATPVKLSEATLRRFGAVPTLAPVEQTQEL